MKKSLTVAVAASAAVVAVASSAFASSRFDPPAGPRGADRAAVAHVVGTFPDDVAGPHPGGYVVWSSGRVQAFDGATYYGSATDPANTVVGFAPGFGGYWLIASTGEHFTLGKACPSGTKLVTPPHAPHADVIGAIFHPAKDLSDGYSMITSSDKIFNFDCDFTKPQLAH